MLPLTSVRTRLIMDLANAPATRLTGVAIQALVVYTGKAAILHLVSRAH